MSKPPLEVAGRALLVVLSLVALPGCSIKKMAINSLGNALAEAGDTYASDEDPELVEGAIPFGLKTIESLLAEAPNHKGLLYAAVSGFTQYAYGFVQQRADFIEDEDYERAEHQRDRANRLYLRALRYGMRALEEEFDDFETRLRRDSDEVLRRAKREHVRLLYWTAASWGAAISIAIEDSELTADQDLMDAMMRRGLALDEAFENGAIHEFFISFEGGRPASGGGLGRAGEASFGTGPGTIGRQSSVPSGELRRDRLGRRAESRRVQLAPAAGASGRHRCPPAGTLEQRHRSAARTLAARPGRRTVHRVSGGGRAWPPNSRRFD